jgi:preprotein translocase subunit SecD
MFRNPRRVFSLLLIIAAAAAYIDSPYSPFSTRLGLDLSGGTHLVMQADMSAIDAASRADALSSAQEVIERRVNFYGVAESVVQTSITGDSYRIIVELPGVTDVAQAEGIIGQTARLEFREFVDVEEATQASTPAQLIAATQSVGITGADLKRAQVIFSQQTGEPQVGFTLTSEGGKKFELVTTRLVGKPLAMFLDDLLLSAPTVQSAIRDEGVITGKFSQEEAKTLALQLNAGALPVPVAVAERRVIGPTLGASSIDKSIRAGAVGFAAVAIYMVLQYGFLGAIALLALALYGLISFALIRVLGITLTLPGIAGAILAIGMAVDSNILIFERYKEERRDGTPSGIAMELAFGKAWDSIRDANLTTILTALILFNPGNWQALPSSGLVRGFAATLLIGVVTSLFTGIVATRTFVRVLYKEKKS